MKLTDRQVADLFLYDAIIADGYTLPEVLALYKAFKTKKGNK